MSRAKLAEVKEVLFNAPSDAPLPKIRAADAPTLIFPDLFSPLEVAVFDPILVAEILTAPAPMLRPLPVPTRAVVR